ncbi:MAG: type I restriction enzyme S subunit [Oleiphilaceae bacterium]|jgi:type I restriction enzyme S subunit
MFNVVKPENLTDRLDADFYKKDFIQNEKTLIECGSSRLSELIDLKKSGYGVLPKSNEYLEQGGVYLIRGGDLSFGAISIPKIRVPFKYKNDKGTTQVGDVLILIKGACIDGPEGVAIISPNERGYVFNGSCYRLCFVNKEIDSHFFIAYSQSTYFLKQKKRWVANTGISYNDESSIKGYLLPKFSQNVKAYIGDKIRQAESLNQWAKSIELAANKLFIEKIDVLGYVERKSEKTGWATLENRLDPVYYNKLYSFFGDNWFIENSKPLTDYISEGSYGVLPASNSYGTGDCRFITATDIVESNYDSRKYTNVPVEEINKKAEISTGQILLEIKGGINYCVVATEILDGTYVNGSVFRFTVKDIDENYLAYYLNSKFKNLYCDRVSVNNIIKYLDQESIYALPVLRLGDDIENKLAYAYRTVQLLNREVFNLTQSAKLLIESLIEGQITEGQITDVQKALEDCDNSKEKAILNKMTDKGYFIEGGKPLFNDLDKLYELLDEAKKETEVDGELA